MAKHAINVVTREKTGCRIWWASLRGLISQPLRSHKNRSVPELVASATWLVSCTERWQASVHIVTISSHTRATRLHEIRIDSLNAGTRIRTGYWSVKGCPGRWRSPETSQKGKVAQGRFGRSRGWTEAHYSLAEACFRTDSKISQNRNAINIDNRTPSPGAC